MQTALPIGFTLFTWWFSTGAILYLDGLPRRTFRWSMLSATLLMAWTLSALAEIAQQTSIAAVYESFAGGIVCWGWVEMSFLMGFITGPRRTPCPANHNGWQRAGFALEAILYHEFALIAVAAMIVWQTWAAPNQLARDTFATLWALRLSAKLNVFLGVRNLGEEFLPEHLRYLQTYLQRKAMNLLFPISVTVATIASALLWQKNLAADTAFHAAQLCFLATLLTLGLLEHWLLIVPMPTTALWSWSMSSRHGTPPHAKLSVTASTPAGAVQ